MVYIQLLCNWCSSNDITKSWSKMAIPNKDDEECIKLTTESEKADYFVIINGTGEFHDKKRSVVFHMEPNIVDNVNVWGTWAKAHEDPDFLCVFTHKTFYNNIEWHLSKSWTELLNEGITKTIDDRVSTVLSRKYTDPGHILRVDFVKSVQDRIPFDVFGEDLGYLNYKGTLPYGAKDKALLPYKYTFNAENNAIPNYFTEKVIDGILSECLTFYWGCPNIECHIDSRCYIVLPLNDKELSLKIIKQSIEGGEWEKRIDAIKLEKSRILKKMSFFSRIDNFFNFLKKKRTINKKLTKINYDFFRFCI